MSLILEALRKSEERRRLGETPTLISESAWSSRRRHPLAQRNRRPLVLLLAVLVLAAPVAAWWLWREPAAEAPASARETTTAAAAPAPAAKAAAPPPAAAATPVAVPAQAVVEPAPPPIATVVPAPVPEATPPVDLPVVDAATQQKMAQPESPATTPAPIATPQPIAAAPVAAASPPVAPPSGDYVPELWQLPLPTRQALPALALTMHVYSADPAQRFALINDKRVAEGSPLENDLDVGEIRPDGVVLVFRGERFLLPRQGR